VIFHKHVVLYPAVIQLVLQICLIFCSTYLCEQLFSLTKRKKIFEISRWTDNNLSPRMKVARTRTLILKLSTNKRRYFLEITVPINEISEHLHSNSVGHTWYRSVTAENWTRDSTNTQTIESTVHNKIWKVTTRRNWYTAVIWKVTEGRN
jgi:hypothetical protein